MLSRPAFRLSCVLVVSGGVPGGGGMPGGPMPGGKEGYQAQEGNENEKSTIDRWLDNALVAYGIWSNATDASKLSRNGFNFGEVEHSICFGLETFWSGNLTRERHPDHLSLREAVRKLGVELDGVNCERCPQSYKNLLTNATSYTSLVRSQKLKLFARLQQLVEILESMEGSSWSAFRPLLQEAHDFWLYASALIKSLSDSWSEDVGNLLQYVTYNHQHLFRQDTTAEGYTAQQKKELQVEYFQKEIIPVAHSKLTEEIQMMKKLREDLQKKKTDGLMGAFMSDYSGWIHLIESVAYEKNRVLTIMDSLISTIFDFSKPPRILGEISPLHA